MRVFDGAPVGRGSHSPHVVSLFAVPTADAANPAKIGNPKHVCGATLITLRCKWDLICLKVTDFRETPVNI